MTAQDCYEQGIFQVQAGNIEAAIPLFRDAIARDPLHREAHYKLAWSLASVGYLDPALETLRHLLTLDPNHVNAYYNLGALLLQKAQLEAEDHLDQALLQEAQSALKKVLRLDPYDAKAAALLQALEKALSQNH
jgi:tetratricopeptide (TPR) repeat protein